MPNIKVKEQTANPSLQDLRRLATLALEQNYTPPQRYGTAFHVLPPIHDLRNLRARVKPAGSDPLAVLADDDQQLLLTLDLSDPYLAWHLAQLRSSKGKTEVIAGASAVPTLTIATEVIHLQSGEERRVLLAGHESASQLYVIVLEPFSRLTLIDQLSDAQMLVRRLQVWQREGSIFSMTGFRAGIQFVSEHVNIQLLGRQAATHVTHLTFGSRQEQSDISVSVLHGASATQSRLHLRTVAADKHRAIYRGLIEVEKGTVQVDGYQSGRALLLSPQATVDQLPQLMIRSDDVRCSHGVTTTHLDDLSLFYLRSRGLGEEQARRLAVAGFFHHQLDVPPEISKSLETVMSNRPACRTGR